MINEEKVYYANCDMCDVEFANIGYIDICDLIEDMKKDGWCITDDNNWYFKEVLCPDCYEKHVTNLLDQIL